MTDLAPRIAADELTHGVFGTPLEAAIAEFAAAAMRAKQVDPVITEIVRLRCAQYHDCRLCGSVRTKDALDAGFDEQMQRKIGDYENGNFNPKIKAALRLCDAMITNPASMDQSLRQELSQHFSSEQIVELCVDVMKWSQQKALVAMRVEPPLSADHLTQLIFDGEGNPVFGDPVT